MCHSDLDVWAAKKKNEPRGKYLYGKRQPWERVENDCELNEQLSTAYNMNQFQIRGSADITGQDRHC